jgi:hypothetical protein
MWKTMGIGQLYLQEAMKRIATDRAMAEKALQQVSDDQWSWQPNAESNSLAIILQHVGGNLVSRWTEFLTTDGEKPDRDRDGEFEPQGASREQLMAIWQKGYGCWEQALASLTEADLAKTVYIRAQAHSVIEAIERSISHTSHHIGQIVYLAKSLRGAEWQTISMPRRVKQ